MQTNSDLSAYIKSQRASNHSDEEIKTTLLAAGWENQVVLDALYNDVPVPTPVPMPNTVRTETHAEVSMWDSFQNILMFISMGTFVVSFSLLLHFFIDSWLPLREYKYYFFENIRVPLVRSYIAAIVVSYPIFVYLFFKIQKETMLNPEIKWLKSRKFLTYLTLIIAFLFILTNVTGVVLTFLNGNVSVNFIAHFVTTVGVSGFIYWYFLKQVREGKNASN